ATAVLVGGSSLAASTRRSYLSWRGGSWRLRSSGMGHLPIRPGGFGGVEQRLDPCHPSASLFRQRAARGRHAAQRGECPLPLRRLPRQQRRQRANGMLRVLLQKQELLGERFLQPGQAEAFLDRLL